MEIKNIAQGISVVSTFCLVLGLFYFPDSTLHVFWGLVIPLLPVTFLISPSFWRSVCPLAVTNKAGNRFNPKYQMPAANVSRSSALSISIFFLLVPARHFLFNEDPLILAYTTLGLLLLAYILGTQYKFKSGFCNAICPVLPVEKLYGQAPLVEFQGSRCSSCSLCTAKGCLDVAPEKSIPKVIGKFTASNRWTITPLGIFILSFPGFILGYFTLPSGVSISPLYVYGYIALSSALSYVISQIVLLSSKVQFSKALPISAACSIGLYYWFASEDISAVLDLSESGIYVVRAFFLLIIGVWLVRGTYLGSRSRVRIRA